ncbi:MULTISPECIES: alpha-ketoacid dehydrogenase subunit beta [Aerococcus]|uniref:alpha-ketoacid dehydrogenase subunit beta n=1 Tax=Aerococcus urinae (strain CCUG 59500 / ACS-120-V-Col10a) TaxID=2976812 RepID=UPI000200F0B9|nr:alpha-ketoacid dehydrogenase subunit beta [Aerococcus sp. Group 1]AEA00315.1 Transketolase, pyridine binding domain protein [Aerococcus sp. Group 1]MCY3030220.1 alpha-ketoacid dehydrogenase subunit beta [Aerococcus sp. Group 1]MCY3054595.1 alpha-ketoacid dehydrogenase subunit beta [Aerococcus sp. Group 1]MCY3056325.1 alpha-ketoacid dehydrogenase subunit beta [Aerococcus sp. Group 1]MCY3061926.1 alpha-ketoacid dehydrogenase subunit beta [Aerococcus sp. Group 1]
MSREIAFMTAINEALDQAMEKDDRVVLLGEDIAGGREVDHLAEENEDAWGGVMGVTKGLGPKYGLDRVIDTPLSEMGYMAAAVGMAVTGLRPVPELMFNDFIGFCLDSLLGQGSKMRYMFGGKAQIPMVVRTMHGAGASAAAQHSGSYYGIFGSIPGIKVVVPATPYDAKGLLLASIEDNNIVVFSEDKTIYGQKGEVPEEYYTIPIGKANVYRQGDDLTIVTIGKMLFVAEEVADRLAEDGISVEVIDLRTVAPWDQETVIESVKKTGRLIVIDESNPHNNTATDIASVVSDKAFDYLDGPIKCICAPNVPVPFAVNLEQLYLPDADKVIEEAAELIDDLRA